MVGMAEDSPAPADRELLLALRRAGAAELVALVRQQLERLDAAAALRALRNPFAGAEVVEALAGRRPLLASSEVRCELVACPQAPPAVSARLLPTLRWAGLMRIGLDPRLAPALRRAADRLLVARLPAMAVGERTSLARRVSAGVLTALRHDPSPRVIAALLDNPRLTEGVLAPLVHRDDAAPEVLRAVAENPRWGVRQGVRAALAKNPRTPVATVLRLLPHLGRPDLGAVARDGRLAPAVRRRARLLLGEGG